jgi:predicted phage terminase large subunit-like protein
MKITRRDYDKKVEEILSLIHSISPFPEGESKSERLARAREDKFYAFRTYFPHYFTLPPAPFHEEMVALLDARKPVAVAAPRGHAKSTIVTFAYPLHQILFGQRHHILIISDTLQQATDFVMRMRLELEENPRILEDFGDLRTRTWGDEEFVTRNGVRVLARGSGQKVRGLVYRQWRPDLILVDDLENDQNVRNPRLVKEKYRWLVEAVYPALEPGGSLFVVGTMLSRHSVLARLLENEAFVSRLWRAWEENGNPIWPARYSRDELERLKGVMGSVAFNKEFGNDPRDEEGLFREEWLIFYHPEQIAGHNLTVFGGIDPSVGSGASSDYKAILTIGISPDRFIYVLDAFIRRCSIDEMIRAAYARYRQYSHKMIALEEVAFQRILFREFDRAARDEGFHLPLRGVKPTVAKESRVAKLSPLVERGIIRFPDPKDRFGGDVDILLEQILYFPSSTVNDDGPDALEMAVSLAETVPTDYSFVARPRESGIALERY